MYRMQIMGNLGNDATVKELKKEKFVIGFSVGTDVKTKDKHGEWKEETVWTQCSYYVSNPSDKLMQLLKKGKRVVIDGRPQAFKYIDKQQETVVGINLIVNDINF